MAGAAVGSIGTGVYDGITYVGNKLLGREDNYSLTEEMWDQTKAVVSKDCVKSLFADFDDTSVGQYINDNASHNKILEKGAYAAGYGAGFGRFAGGIRKLTGVTIPVSSAITGGISSAGSGAQKAWNDGANIKDGLKYAATNAAWGAGKSYATSKILEIFYGDIVEQGSLEAPIKEKNLVTDAGKTVYKFVTKNEITTPLKDAADKEVQPYLQQIYKDNGTSIESSNNLRDFNNRTKPSSNINNDNNINVN